MPGATKAQGEMKVNCRSTPGDSHPAAASDFDEFVKPKDRLSDHLDSYLRNWAVSVPKGGRYLRAFKPKAQISTLLRHGEYADRHEVHDLTSAGEQTLELRTGPSKAKLRLKIVGGEGDLYDLSDIEPTPRTEQSDAEAEDDRQSDLPLTVRLVALPSLRLKLSRPLPKRLGKGFILALSRLSDSDESESKNSKTPQSSAARSRKSRDDDITFRIGSGETTALVPLLSPGQFELRLIDFYAHLRGHERHVALGRFDIRLEQSETIEVTVTDTMVKEIEALFAE